MSLVVGVLLFVAGVAAGFVNTVAGAGSLLTVPALLLAGLPAGEANATNRVAVMAQSVTGGTGFSRGGWLHTSALVAIAVPTVAGGAVGSVVATVMADEVLVVVLLVTMVVVGVRFAFFSSAGPSGEGRARFVRSVGETRGSAVLLFGGGFYGGLVQSGVGIVLLAIFGGVLGYDLVRANALKVVITGAFTAVSLAIFVASGLVRWGPGLVLAAGSVVGATVGVRVAVTRGQGLIRVVVLVMVAVVVVQQCVMLAGS